MRDLTVSEIERLRAETADDAVPLEMDEEAFRGFYDRTARTLRAYLSRVTGDPALADDLLQEAYYRLLRARGGYEGEAHRRNALFRIATNLVHDSRRRAQHVPPMAVTDQQAIPDAHDTARSTERATDLRRAMGRLKPRERELLWLAYAQGSSHKEIAECLGLRTGSVKLLLFRARRRLAALLRGRSAETPERSLL
jgi:RNA polymerase sigma-70 factor (ECF subfamily)